MLRSPDRTAAPPATGAWREGDPVGGRRFETLGDVALESGTVLPDVRLAYETWGELDRDASNAVLVLHALTGDSHVSGDAGPGHPSPGWWAGLVGPGRAVDTDRYFVVAPNILGGCQGSTGPSSPGPDGRPWGARFPALTVRDQVAAEARLADRLGITRWAAVTGGSAGGMRALEWAITWPERVAALFLLASSATASADQIGLSTTQVEAIRADHAFAGGDYYDAADGEGPHRGLALARRVAHLSYRSADELEERFGREAQDDGRWAVESYLAHHGDKLVHRFDANSYVTLTRAMDTHDVGRGRGGVDAALARITARTVVAGIDSDRLYPLAQQEQIADAVPTCDYLDVVESLHGHDGFLVELDAVDPLARRLLDT
ncbi:MAG: homoserine O-acetyltransferase [Nocardioidaceae bacterium]|nr:homoserine O-acetyltransferase [Nocardioidaceae bacterium]